MSQGVIVIKKPNQEIPQEFLVEALANCPKVWGAALVDGGVLEIMQGHDPKLEDLVSTLAEFKELGLTLYLGDSTAGTNLKAVPPFPLIETDDEQPLVAVIPEGNFPGFAKDKSSFPPAYHLAEHLFDDFNAAFDMCDKDLSKFMANIEKDSFKKKMNLTSVSRGYITVVAQNGSVVTFAQGDTAKDFDWGWCSNSFGYGVTKEAPVEQPKKKGMFSRSTIREKHEPVAHVPSDDVVASGAVKPTPTETAVKAPDSGVPKVPVKEGRKPFVIEDIKRIKMKVPPMNRKNRSNWVKERIGYKPNTIDDVNAVYEVFARPDGSVLTRDEINKLFGLSAASLPKLTNAPPIGANTENTNVDSQQIIQPLPILSGSARERAKRFISDERRLKMIDENSSIITDPENVQGTETKIPFFHHQLGEKELDQWLKLPFTEKEAYGRQDIHGLACFAQTLTQLYLIERKKNLGKAITEKMKEQLTPVAEAKEEPPKKRGMFSRNAA